MYTYYGPWHQEFLHEVQHRTEMPSLKRWTRRLWAPAKATLARRIERAAVRHARRVVVLSRYSQSQLAEVHAVSGARVSIVPGGADLQQFVPRLERREARSRLGLAGEGPLLFTVRRLVPRMGLESLLHALVRLPDARLVIGGSGWLRPRLEASASALGVASRVRFAGRIDDAELPVFYQAADLVVLPSVALEGFGLITLEALACGTPVVATANSGATDVVGPLEPSWIAPDASPAALATTIAGALSASCAPPGGRRSASCRSRPHRRRPTGSLPRGSSGMAGSAPTSIATACARCAGPGRTSSRLKSSRGAWPRCSARWPLRPRGSSSSRGRTSKRRCAGPRVPSSASCSAARRSSSRAARPRAVASRDAESLPAMTS